MAFPNLLKRLFDTNGAGVTLRGDIMPFSAEAPKAGGTASAGTSNTVARADHVHPAQTIGTASGTVSGTTKLSDATNSTSGADSGVAATPKAVKAAYDKAVEAKSAASTIFSGTDPGQVPASTSEETGKVLRSDGMWNNTSLDPISEKAQALGDTTDNKAIDVSKGAYITCTITGNTTFSFTGVPQTGATVVVMQLTNGGAYTITWPSSIKWSGGKAPKFTASGIDIVILTTNDAGATWYGIVNLKYV